MITYSQFTNSSHLFLFLIKSINFGLTSVRNILFSSTSSLTRNNSTELYQYVVSISDHLHSEYFPNNNHVFTFKTPAKGTQILPDEILWRTKEAFSDGVCANSRSLYQILQEHISAKLNKDNNTTNYTQSIETEKMYYKQIFNKIYPNSSHLLPYYWMPKYSNTNVPSARTLDIYK